MNVLVTGGGGFLGGHIIRVLLKRQYTVTNLSRNLYPELEEIGVKTIQLDLCEENKVNQLDLSSFDAIFHVAALAGVWGKYEKYYSINYLGTKNLMNKAILDKVKHFIYTSTPSVVFGRDDIRNGDESLCYPDHYLTAYAKTKSMAEELILNQTEINTVALRPHLIWGPGDPHILPRLKEKARLGRLKRVGQGDNLVDVIYVENAAKAHVDALEGLIKNSALSGNAYFIGQEDPVNLWDFINTLLTKSKLEPIESSISYKNAYRLGYVLEKIYKFIGITKPEPPMTRFVATQLAKNHYFSHAKAKNDFGYVPSITTSEGLRRTFLEVSVSD